MINTRDILKEKAPLIQEKLQVAFNNQEWLLQAFTHSSYSNEDEGVISNERLEFLGDAVLGQIVTTFLFKKFVYILLRVLFRLFAHLLVF